MRHFVAALGLALVAIVCGIGAPSVAAGSHLIHWRTTAVDASHVDDLR